MGVPLKHVLRRGKATTFTKFQLARTLLLRTYGIPRQITGLDEKRINILQLEEEEGEN